MGRLNFKMILAVALCSALAPSVLEVWRDLVTRGRKKPPPPDLEDTRSWYTVNVSQLSPALRDKFIQMTADDATMSYLQECVEIGDQFHWQIFYRMARAALSFFLTKTSINGLLNKKGMFVFSEQQYRTLLGISDTWWQADKLLDIGAGNGAVTARIASHFRDVYATELSKPMVWRLQDRGFSVLPVDGWHNGSLTYDVITCLNVLDRCDRPLTMLDNVGKVLSPDKGRLVVAVVIPVKQQVETGSGDQKNLERLQVRGSTFEESISSLVFDVMEPAGLELLSFTRLPYLSPGNMRRPYYTLTDAILVLRKAS